MKLWIALLCTLVAGVVAGAVWSFSEFRGVDEVFDTRMGEDENISDGPRLRVVNGASYDFGYMDRYGKRRHTFILKNDGNKPLKLKQKDTTCKCTLSSLEELVLAPGETAPVTLEWTATETGPTPQFEQQARIDTNDPSRKLLALTVRGKIRRSVRTVPANVTLANVSASRGIETTIKLLSFISEGQVGVTKVEYVNPSLQPHMDLKMRPLTPDEFGDKDAKSGLLLKLKLKPGLPLGTINQTIRLTTNLPDSPIVMLPIEGDAVGDISVFGTGYNRTRRVLDLGTVKSADGAKVTLQVLAKGPDRAKALLRVAKVSPEKSLNVTVGKPMPANNNKAMRFPITIEIKKGARPVRFLSSQTENLGYISFTAEHPQMKTFNIYVRFAIEP